MVGYAYILPLFSRSTMCRLRTVDVRRNKVGMEEQERFSTRYFEGGAVERKDRTKCITLLFGSRTPTGSVHGSKRYGSSCPTGYYFWETLDRRELIKSLSW